MKVEAVSQHAGCNLLAVMGTQEGGCLFSTGSGLRSGTFAVHGGGKLLQNLLEQHLLLEADGIKMGVDLQQLQLSQQIFHSGRLEQCHILR
ncbi:hypothetical protein D3C75_936560 [compost metagenome]